MPVQLFTNNATTLLDADITIGATSLTVTTSDGALFPNPTAGDWFYATIQSGSIVEIVQVTSRTGDTFDVIVRGQDGTSAAAWTAGATVELRLSKVWLDTVHTTNSLPAPGDVVGPGSSVDDRVAFFDGTTGKLIKDSGVTLAGSNTGDQTLPIDSTITVTDNTGNNATTSAHGWLPKGTNVTRHFLRSDVSYAAIPGMEVMDPVVNGSTTFTGVTTADMLADQYEIEFTTDVGVMDASRVTPTVSTIHTATGQRINHALRVDVTTIDASIGVAEFVTLSQKIEGYRAQPFIHNEFTVSFYVRSNLTGQFALAVGNSIDDRNYIQTFSPAVADTWERISVTVASQDLTGTWDYQTGIGLNLRWTLAAGTNHEGTNSVWNSTADFAVAGQVNFLSSTSNYIELTGVQMDLGPDAKAYRGVPIDKDLAAAERYFQKSYNIDVDPGATSALGQVACIQNSTTHKEFVHFRTPMRAAPTVVAYNPTDGTAAQWEDVGVGGEAVTLVNSGMTGVTVAVTAGTDGLELNGHWTAESKL
jgi:hypothetical protein